MNMIYEKHESNLMERIEELKSKNQVMPDVEKWRYFIQIALVLQYLNNKRIIHRMLHPKKILFDKKGRVKVTNFQWSCPVGSKQKVAQAYYATH